MDSKKYQMTITDEYGSRVEEFSAVIGIEIIGNQVKLHILDSPEIPEEFWRKLPDYMRDGIEQGMKSRRESIKAN